MVLESLGKSLSSTLSSLISTRAPIDDSAVDAVLKDVCKALLEADVNVKLVQQLRNGIKASLNLENQPVGINKRRLVHKAVIDGLCKLLDPGVVPFTPKRNQRNVIMLVGLQGAGKTTTCTKLAYWFARKGWKTAVICADTFRAGAFDQLKQNSTKAKIPFFGDVGTKDPVPIIKEGLEVFKDFEIVIVDTSGRHKQANELFVEMQNIYEACQPDQTIFVMDAAMGQAAEAHAKAFKEAVPVGAIILSKADGHARGGGAMSAVAATGSPIAFIGTGEHFQDFEAFSVKRFVSKLLGMGDIQGLIESVQDAQRKSTQNPEEMLKKLEQGVFTLRDMNEQLKMIVGMGPLSKVMSLLPGMPSDLLGGINDEDGGKKMRKCLTILDSMTRTELDSDGKCFLVNKANQSASATAISRMKRIAKGSGNSVSDVEDALTMYRKFATAIKKMGPMMTGRRGPAGAMGNNPGMMQRLQSMMPDNMQEMMQAMQSQMGDMMGSGQLGMPQLQKKGFRQTRRK